METNEPPCIGKPDKIRFFFLIVLMIMLGHVSTFQPPLKSPHTLPDVEK